MHSVFLNRKILIKKNRKNILVIEIKEDLSYVQTIWQIVLVIKKLLMMSVRTHKLLVLVDHARVGVSEIDDVAGVGGGTVRILEFEVEHEVLELCEQSLFSLEGNSPVAWLALL